MVLFSIPLLLILGIHELGHAMCRRHACRGDTPLLPAPTDSEPDRTFGALITDQRADPRQEALIEIARRAARRFFTAIPFSRLRVAHTQTSGHSRRRRHRLFRLSDPRAVHGDRRRAGTRANGHEHPMFMAAWFGLLVTALNFFRRPARRGHVLRAALGGGSRSSYAVLLCAALLRLEGTDLGVLLSLHGSLPRVRHPPAKTTTNALLRQHDARAPLPRGLPVVFHARADEGDLDVHHDVPTVVTRDPRGSGLHLPHAGSGLHLPLAIQVAGPFFLGQSLSDS